MSEAEMQCSLCGERRANLLLCGKCREVRYCSKEHQTTHWFTHKVECKLKIQQQKVEPETEDVKPPADDLLSCLSALEEKVSQLRLKDFTVDTPTNSRGATNGEASRSSVVSSTGAVRRRKYRSNGKKNKQKKKRKKKNNRKKEEKGETSNPSSRKSSSNSEPDYSTPIDLTESIARMGSQQPHQSSSLFQLNACPIKASYLDKNGFNTRWFNEVVELVVEDLNHYGVCVIDKFLGKDRAVKVLKEVQDLHMKGMMTDGQVVSRSARNRVNEIRGDKTTWVSGQEPACNQISHLMNVVDAVIMQCNKVQNPGKLGQYSINLRTRAMVACYPGVGTHYVKHVDNPNGDGRCITAIFYLNKNWDDKKGGTLRIFPEGMDDQVMNITPIFDRMLFFWSDRRNPHEVLPAYETRYAITLWYLDQVEREVYQRKVDQMERERLQTHIINMTSFTDTNGKT